MVRQIKQWQERRSVKKRVGSFDSRGLIQAILTGDLQSLQKLLNGGISPDTLGPSGSPALSYAVEAGRVEFVKSLLQAGAQADLPGENGLTALMIAARSGDVKSSLLLLEHNASPNTTSLRGQTPLMLTQRESIAKILLEAGALPDKKDEQGKTALIYAVEQGHTGVAKTLLTEGADPNIRDLAGKTALDAENLSPGLVKILRNAGGKTESELLAETEKSQRSGTTLEGLVSILETLSLSPGQLGKLVEDARGLHAGDRSFQSWMEKGKSTLEQVGDQWNLREWEQQVFANGSAAETLKEELQWLLEWLVELKRIGISVRDIAAATHSEELNSFRKLQAQLMTGTKGFADYMEQVAREKCAVDILTPAGTVNGETILLQWLVKERAPIEAGQALCELQQGETIRKIFAEKPGILIHKAWKNDRLIAGGVLGRIEPLPPEKEKSAQEKLLSLALIEAVPTGNAELIRLLIAAGADAQTADHTGIPASQLAADQPEIPAIPQPKPKQHL